MAELGRAVRGTNERRGQDVVELMTISSTMLSDDFIHQHESATNYTEPNCTSFICVNPHCALRRTVMCREQMDQICSSRAGIVASRGGGKGCLIPSLDVL